MALNVYDFTVKDRKGNDVSLADYKGKVLLIVNTAYGTEFPQFKKIEVNGDNESPLFTYLKAQKGFEGFDLNHKIGKLLNDMMLKADPDYASKPDIKWNFTKFLVNQQGEVIARYEPTHDIKLIEADIQALLK